MTEVTMICDARLSTDRAGRAGRVEAIARDGKPFSLPVGACSADTVAIWHGMDTAAVACGTHAQHRLSAVFHGHRNRVGSRPRDHRALPGDLAVTGRSPAAAALSRRESPRAARRRCRQAALSDPGHAP
jgi:hypothetical protein